MDGLTDRQQHRINEWFQRGHKVIVHFWRLNYIDPPENSDVLIRNWLTGNTTSATVAMPPHWLLKHSDGVEMLDEMLNGRSNEALPPPRGYSWNLGFCVDLGDSDEEESGETSTKYDIALTMRNLAIQANRPF